MEGGEERREGGEEKREGGEEKREGGEVDNICFDLTGDCQQWLTVPPQGS